MSNRPLDINLTSSTEKTLDSSQEKIDFKSPEFKKRVAQILDRGFAVDRLHVDLPPHLYGEWVSRDQQAIHRMELLGFKIDTEYARARRLHDGGDGASYVGDVVFMVAPREVKEAIDEVRRDVYNRTHLKRQREDSEFVERNKELGMPPIANSTLTNVSGPEIEAALKPQGAN